MPTKLPVLLVTLSAPFVAVLGVALVATFVVPTVTLSLERPSYAIGDTVRFTLRNGLDGSVYLTGSAPWHISRDVDGVWRPVESHAELGVILELAPGTTRTWSWIAQTQAGPGLVPVEPGAYRIDISVLTGCGPSLSGCQTISLSVPFRIT